MILAIALLVATPVAASAHHEQSIPPPRVLERIYPDIAKRDLPKVTIRKILVARWRLKHPAAEREHRLFTLFATVASCESGGRWSISTGNGYYGGLQMDRTFAKTYDRWAYYNLGTPNNWSRERQIKAAIRAYRTRGLGPWPKCGKQKLGYRPV